MRMIYIYIEAFSQMLLMLELLYDYIIFDQVFLPFHFISLFKVQMAPLFLCIIFYLYIQSYIILHSCFSMRFRVAFRCRKWNRFEEQKARRELRTAGEHFRRAGKRNLPLAIHDGNNILVTFHLHTLHPYFSPTVFLSGEVSFPARIGILSRTVTVITFTVANMRYFCTSFARKCELHNEYLYLMY